MICRKYYIFNFISCLLLCMLICASWAIDTQAEMKPMDNKEMQEVTAQKGFATFNINDNTAEAVFGVEADIHATFDSWKWGHWNNPDDPDHGEGWDNNWSNVVLHSPEDPYDNNMEFRDFVIKAGFDDIDSPNRQLNHLTIGFKKAKGQLDPDDFESFSAITDGHVAFGENSDTITKVAGTFAEGPYHRSGADGILAILGNDIHFNGDQSFLCRIQLRGKDEGGKYPKGIWAETSGTELDVGLTSQ